MSAAIKCPNDEKLPLILQLTEEGTQQNNIESPPDSSRSNRVSTGVAMVLGNWPGYITAGCVSAAFLSVVTILTVIMIVAIVIISSLDSNLQHRFLTSRQSTLLGIETPCDFHLEEQKRGPNSVVRKRDNSSSSDLQTSPPHHVFFITTQDAPPRRHLCAVESAARVMPNCTCFLIIITSKRERLTETSEKSLTELLNMYQNIKIVRVSDEKYFYDSPLRGITENFPPYLITFAARILTLWRYSGVTYDLDLVTISNSSGSSYPMPKDDNVMLSRDSGSVMSVKTMCHAFLYELMSTLVSFHKDQQHEVSNNFVIQRALKDFCAYSSKKHVPFTDKEYKICKGVSAMPSYLVCRDPLEIMSASSSCVWASCHGSNDQFRKNLCPFSYRHTSIETPITMQNYTHKKRHKHLF
ncbi:uncharacterized protein [Periplaneta americana]|uniref:uncharacterized protein n=1 Tax=Periplaneta americana TaxID=6978 RepID=UPI0037E990CD